MEVWVGLVGVGPLKENRTLGEAKGAYVNALALACDEKQYMQVVSSALKELGLFAFEYEDIERFDERANNQELRHEMHNLAKQVRSSGQVCFDTFHAYSRVDG